MAVGVQSDPDLTMHSLRHTWATLAREIDMPDHVAHAITRRVMADHAAAFRDDLERAEQLRQGALFEALPKCGWGHASHRSRAGEGRARQVRF
jgi:integrase